MVDAQAVAQRARSKRRERGLKREELAVLAKVSVSTVDNLEQGRALPRIETLDRIAHVLGVSILKLLADPKRPLAA